MSSIAALALSAFVVIGDGIPEPLTTVPGDAGRGRALVASRQQGLCLLCHQAPIAAVPEQGNLATNLAGAGNRWNAAQLRLRVADSRVLNPNGLMPSLYRAPTATEAQRVAKAWQGRPVLDAQQVEDVVAYLLTLK